LTWLQFRKYVWNVLYQIKCNKVSPSKNIFWQLQKIYTIAIHLKRLHNPSRTSSSNFNTSFSHRFMQQLEDALNVSLCGKFLISVATMCIAAFSIVTVQYNNSWSFYHYKYQLCKIWGRVVRKMWTDRLHEISWKNTYRLSLGTSVTTLLSIRLQYKITREKLRLSRLVIFVSNLGKCIDCTFSSSSQQCKIHKNGLLFY
jgi:hypothetical protein